MADGLYWGSASATSVGNASYSNTATNIAGGAQYDIPFQTATGLTGFDTGLFQYDDSTKTLKVDSASLSGSGMGTVTLSDTNNGGVQLYSTTYAQLNYDNTNYVWVQSDGTHLSTTGGELTLDTSGNLTLSTTGGTFQANYVNPTNLTSTRVTYYNGTSLVDSANLTFNGSTLSATYVNPSNLTNTHVTYYDGDTLVDSSNLTFDGTTLSVTGLKDTALTVTGGLVFNSDGAGTLADNSNLTWNGTSLTVGGSGGDITMSGGNITGVNNVSAVSLTASDLTDTYVVFAGASGLLTDSSSFTYASDTLTAPNIVASSTTDTTGSSDGALVVDGGAYVAKRLFVNGDGGGILADGNGGGAVAIYGGLDVNNNIFADGGVATNGGTETKPDLGSAGGAYIGKDLYVGTTATFAGDIYVDGTLYIKGKELTGIDQISGSTATFANLTATYITANHSVAINGGVPTLGGSNTTPDLSISGGAYIAKDLYVESTATFNGIVYIDGVNVGNALTASSAVIGELSSTGTLTATNILVTNLTATVLTVTTTATVQDFNVLGNFSVNGFTLGHFKDLYSTGTAYLNNVSITGTTTASNLTVTGSSDLSTLQIHSDSDNGTGFNNNGTTSSQYWSLATAGGIYAFKNITAGGVVSAGDATTVNGNDTGSVDAFYAVNNIQAARTVKSISGNTPTEIDRWDKTHFTSAKYLVQIVDSGNIYVSEFMIVTDGTANNYISEYGIVNNNGDLGEFNVTNSGNFLVFEFTPTSATSMTIQVVRQSILTAIEGFC